MSESNIIFPASFEPQSELVKDDKSSDVSVGVNHGPLINFITLDVHREMWFRKLYLYIESVSNPNPSYDYVVEGEIRCFNKGTQILKIPANIAKDPSSLMLTGNSIAGIINPQGSPGADAMGVYLSNKFSVTSDPVFLSPHRFVSRCDKITYSMTRALGYTGSFVTTIKAYLMVRSANYSF